MSRGYRYLTPEETRKAAAARRNEAAVEALVHRDRRHQEAVLRGAHVRKPGEPRGLRWD